VSELATNVMHFARLLRRAGLPLGPAASLDALHAAEVVDVFQRDQLYWALHAVLVRRPEDHDLYDEAFRLFWRDPFGGDAARALLLSHSKLPSKPAISRRLSEAFRAGRGPPTPRTEEVEVEATVSWASDEILRTRDFDQMSADELRRAKRAVREMEVLVRPVRTRRFEPAHRGSRVDLARTLRDSLRSGGDLAPLRLRRRRLVPPPVVALCDISGSMGRYAEMLIAFLQSLVTHRRRVHVFLFATRLSNVTRVLRGKDPDAALARCGKAVSDWAGGTRLRACLHEFNRSWSRRVLAGGAVVLLVTDGLDRDETPGLEAEAERLHKSCRRLVWLNPLLRYEGFEPLAQGVRALLPHVDEHRPVHDLRSLSALADALR
jgi:hypothetical protein